MAGCVCVCIRSVGAVQCGFCIPGMVMAGTALLQNNLNPTEEDIKYALRGNICRCTGYKKIIEGIQLVQPFSREMPIDEDLERAMFTVSASAHSVWMSARRY